MCWATLFIATSRRGHAKQRSDRVPDGMKQGNLECGASAPPFTAGIAAVVTQRNLSAAARLNFIPIFGGPKDTVGPG